MSIVVQKYGGSSVADVHRIQDVARRIARTAEAGHQLAVVVSAMGNTTTELIELARSISPEPDRRELDMLVSVGERISMALLAMALRDLGIPAKSLTGSQAGILTDDAHGDARVVEVRPERVQAVMDRGEVAIIAGFQGVSLRREVTTLGRGGSDTTAIAMAAALGAEWCEICSDVDGVFSADPRVVDGARKLSSLTLDDALALARGGAKVLHEDAVRLARDAGVEVRAVATAGPGSGSRIASDKPLIARSVGVTGDAQLVKLRFGAVSRVEAMAAVVAAGGRMRRQVGELFYVDTRNVHGGSLRGVHPSVVFDGPAAMVTAVSSGLGQEFEWVHRGTDAILEGGVWVMQSGADGDCAWWEVPPASVQKAVDLVHQALVEPSAHS